MTSFFLLTTTTFLMKIFILNHMWGYMNKKFAYSELGAIAEQESDLWAIKRK